MSIADAPVASVGAPASPAARARPRLPWSAVVVLAAFALVIAAAWAVTLLTSNDLMMLLGGELAGATPIDHLTFVALTTVMMAAMMLPGAVPMVSAYLGLSRLDAGRAEGGVRATILTGTYVAVWGAFAAAVLVPLMALGLIGGLSGPWVVLPGAILLAAGLYQFSSLKRSCLEGCQSPSGFLFARWRSGRAGAARLGASYATYCLGCCWLLMLVVFSTAAMSLLWMGIFSALVLAEKTVGQNPWFTRGLGVVATGVGAWVAAAALIAA